jgi:ubiquinol-cytochrome c reductase iron-sulfur subunit
MSNDHPTDGPTHGPSDHGGLAPHNPSLAPDELLAPGLPAHVLRQADTDPKASRKAERQVAGLFMLSAVATIAFIVCFVTFNSHQTFTFIGKGVFQNVSASNFSLGVTLGVAILAIGLGAIHWARKLMPDVEMVDERHPIESGVEDSLEFQAQFEAGVADSGITSRPLIRRTLLGAMTLLPLSAIVILRDLGPLPHTRLRHTTIKPGVRLVTDVNLLPIKPEDVPVGGLVSCVPESLKKTEEEEGTLNERGKVALMLIRLRPDQIVSQQGKNWDVQGILAFSKVCTHVGCPLGLYEQQTHHMLCPCHQSTFDLADNGNVVFGPAARHLPQLPITVNDEGYLVAVSDFKEPIGPSFWERG